MVVKVYISGISGNKEVKKRQQRVLMILDSKNVKYDIIDITEPGREDNKEFMQNNSKSNGGTVSDPNPRTPLPPQVFNDDEYCGDYDQFDLANEVDTLELFLKLEAPTDEPQTDDKPNALNGVIKNTDEEKESKEKSQEREETEVLEKSEETKEIPKDNDNSTQNAEEVEAPVEKEKSPVRNSSADKDVASVEDNQNLNETDIQSKQIAENEATSEDALENGAARSRDHSEEKNEENLSEALIQSEKLSSAE